MPSPRSCGPMWWRFKAVSRISRYNGILQNTFRYRSNQRRRGSSPLPLPRRRLPGPPRAAGVARRIHVAEDTPVFDHHWGAAIGPSMVGDPETVVAVVAVVVGTVAAIIVTSPPISAIGPP